MTQHNDGSDFLNGKLLVALPGMGDPRFDRSVIYMCAHSAEGAMGLIVNKPARDLKFGQLLKQLDIEGTAARSIEVFYGGPVEHGRGFVLHSADYLSGENTMQVDAGYAMTATIDILRDIATGGGPRLCLLALGYAGWGPGQLESEFKRNGWLTCAATEEIVFRLPAARKWERALETLGVTPSMLSRGGGQA